MNHAIRVFVMAALAGSNLLLAQSAQNFAALKGSYSYVEEGTNALGQRYARIGILELDGTGAALAGDVAKTSGGAAIARLSGNYLPMDDGSVEVKLFTTSTVSDEDIEVTTSTPHSSIRLIAAGQGVWEGLRTDSGVSGVIKMEIFVKPSVGTARRYTMIEEGVSATPYSLLGTLDWSAVQSATASLLVKQSTLDSFTANGTAIVDAAGLASITLQSDNDAGTTFRATYMGVPVNKGADWALVRMDSGVLASAKLVSR